MAKAKLSDESLKEIFVMHALADHNPTERLIKELEKLTSKSAHELKTSYADIYEQVKKDGDPYAPIGPMVG